jgi:chemotaxis protein methyltransferase CheR
VSPAREPSSEQIQRFRAFTAGRLGLRMEDGQVGLLAEALRRRLEDTGLSPDLYLASLESTTQVRDEIRSVAQELTVTETYFFRNEPQFRALREVVLPDCVRAQAARRRLRILSAGCASGEEAYSIAILLRDAAELLGWDVAIRGIDINVAMLARASRAHYSAWSLRETPAELRARCFRVLGREFLLEERFRTLATFDERNLAEPDAAFWAPESFDVVFCRNVLMYFTPETAEAVVARIARSLVPGGYLFLGHAETLRGLSHDFQLCHTHGTFYYQRHPRVGRARPEPASPGPALEPSPELLPALSPLLPNDSWVEAIGRSAERIHSLTSSDAGARVERDPAAATTLRAGRYAGDLGVAVELIRQERFPEAEAALTTLPAGSAGDADVLLLRAILVTHGGDLAAAEKLCAKVLELDGMTAGAHYLMALCREDAGDRAGASHHDRIAAYLDPGFALPRLHLGLLARRSGDQAGARGEFGEALLLLQREDASRLLLFGGGFSREALIALCRAELASCGGRS